MSESLDNVLGRNVSRSRSVLALSAALATGWAWAQNSRPADPANASAAKVESPKASLTTPIPAASSAAVDPNVYVIGALDVLYVKVFRDTDFSGDYLVRSDGKITLPLAGDLQAAGLTPEQLTGKLRDALSQWIIMPDVNVIVQQVNSKMYTVAGEVNRPNKYPLLRETRVFDAINEAGGFKDFANKKDIIIVRGTQRLHFNYEDVKRGKKLEQNIPLQNGDTVLVQ
ncbi:MAG TPA: polysaccharide biosynthesis/export family protein [Bryobacteraceae bacterium]|nr:polysaccharide biosynthesis/export family protein [Bryobacteraceae bacterium]